MTRIFDEVEDWFHRREHHPHYHASNETPEAPMALLDTIRGEVAHLLALGEDEVRRYLPTVARLADDAEAAAASPLAQAVAAAVHLPPAVEQSFADAIAKVDAELHAAAQHVAANMQAGDPQPAQPEPAQ